MDKNRFWPDFFTPWVKIMDEKNIYPEHRILSVKHGGGIMLRVWLSSTGGNVYNRLEGNPKHQSCDGQV